MQSLVVLGQEIKILKRGVLQIKSVKTIVNCTVVPPCVINSYGDFCSSEPILSLFQ